MLAMRVLGMAGVRVAVGMMALLPGMVCAGQAKHTAEAWPDALVTEAGRPVASAAAFTQVRRAELLRAFAENVYGRTPEEKLPMAVKVTSEAALDGAAVRKQVTLTVGMAATVVRGRGRGICTCCYICRRRQRGRCRSLWG